MSSIKDRLSTCWRQTSSTAGSARSRTGARWLASDRLKRASNGNFGDVKSVGSGVSEMRIDYGPGYRVYFFRRGKELVVLLCGGDKKSQNSDIAAAVRMKEEIERSGQDDAV